MKFAAIIEYGDDKAGLRANHPAHRTYLRTFLENGQLRAAGPFAEDAGALWVLDTDTAEAAEKIVREDPLVDAGVIRHWVIRPMAYWSARRRRAPNRSPILDGISGWSLWRLGAFECRSPR